MKDVTKEELTFLYSSFIDKDKGKKYQWKTIPRIIILVFIISFILMLLLK